MINRILSIHRIRHRIKPFREWNSKNKKPSNRFAEILAAETTQTNEDRSDVRMVTLSEYVNKAYGLEG